MEDLSQNVSNFNTMTEQPTSAVPTKSAGQQPNQFSAVPGTSAGQRPNQFLAIPGTPAGQQSNQFSAVPGTSTGRQPNQFSAIPGTPAGRQPNQFSAVPSTLPGRKWNTPAICILNRILKARVKKIRRIGFDYRRICVEYIRAHRDLKH
jgi:hypothetical protein